jgi:Fe-Mn family superoxide dismutase
MMEQKFYVLPPLPYGYKDLEPYVSEQTLRVHHDTLHQKYVNNANHDLEKLDAARRDNTDPDMKALLKDLAFNAGGHILHTLLWENMTPKGAAPDSPYGELASAIEGEFGCFARFKREFAGAAFSVEGSGWAALSWDTLTRRLLIMQIEKHDVNIYPSFRVLMVLDAWEHAYYLDHKSDRAGYIDAFWNVCNWERVGDRFDQTAGIPPAAALRR